MQSIFRVVIAALEEHLPVDFCCIGVYEPTQSRLTVTSVGSHSAALAESLGLSEQARIEIGENGLSRCVRGELVYEPDLGEIRFPFPQRLAAEAACAPWSPHPVAGKRGVWCPDCRARDGGSGLQQKRLRVPTAGQ